MYRGSGVGSPQLILTLGSIGSCQKLFGQADEVMGATFYQEKAGLVVR